MQNDSNIFKILFFGDVCGDAGLRALRFMLSDIKKEYNADMVIVNGENSDKGYGISESSFNILKQCPIDVITLGNHGLEKEDIYEELEINPMLLRPDNFMSGNPGKGSGIFEINGTKVGVINLHTRSGINFVECPFKTADKLVNKLSKETKIIFIDIHGEETYEKEALHFFLKGRVSAVIGSHTHVQTMDEKIVEGTGYLTDAGMCGAIASVIGGNIEESVNRARECLPKKVKAADGRATLMGVCVSIQKDTGKCVAVERIHIDEKD